MTNSKKLLMGLFFVLFSATSQAQNFYVCDSNGKDEFDGRSEAKPFKTYDKGIWRFNELKGGDSLLFCRGGKFQANKVARLFNKNCSASNKCTIGDYGNQGLPKPLISSNGVHAINFENGGDAREDGGYVVKNLTIIAAKKSGAGIRLYNDVDDVTISNVHVEGFNVGVYSADSKQAAKGDSANGFNDRLLVENSTIINNKKIGFLGACNNCLINNNHFENNGTHPSLDHNIYLAQKGKPARGITIRNNTLYKSAIVNGKCQGVSLVGHGLLEDILIENNVIKEDAGKVTGGCWGISIDPGYSKEDESFKNIVIRNNKIINIGGNAIGCASCDGVIVEGNEIIDEAKTMTAGIRIPVREENTTKSKDVVIRNNKIIASHENTVGVWVGGIHASIVSNNQITLPNNSRVECIFKTLANTLTNTKSNLCKLHNGVSILDPNVETLPTQGDEQVSEIPVETIPNPVKPVPNENGQEVVDNSPITDESTNQQPEIVDNPTGNDNSGVITEPTNSGQFPSPVVVENGSTKSNETIKKPISKASNPTTNGSKVSVNEQVNDASSPTLNSKPRNAASGGSSSGSSSSSKPKSSTTTNTDMAATDNVISYTPKVQSSADGSTSVMSLETEEMDITSGLPKMDSESSKFSVKVKDVIKATRDENQVADVTKCRAYTAGKCLMK